MKTIIVNQARMTSTRLPGKVMKEVLGKPLLEYQIERLKWASEAEKLIIATTVNDSDQPIVDLCERLGVAYYRGSEEDVLSRYYHAACAFEAEAVVRITADCPLIDPQVVNRVIAYYTSHKNRVDYVSNVLQRTYPRGMDTEVFSFAILEQAHFNAKKPYEREHVTPYIRQLNRHRIANIAYREDQSRHRWTMDQEEDFELIKNIISELYPLKKCFSMEDVLNLMAEHPDWFLINAEVEQKQILIDGKMVFGGVIHNGGV